MLYKIIYIYFHFNTNIVFLVLYTAFNNLTVAFYLKRKFSVFLNSLSAKKRKRGDPLGFLKLQFVAKYQKFKGALSRHKIEKRRTVPKKLKGGHYIQSRPVLYLKLKME